MDIHQLWKKETAGEQKSRENIRKKLNAGASGLGEAKLEILAELIFFVLFVSVFYKWFDGYNKPLWLSLSILALCIWMIVNHVLVYRTMSSLWSGDNVVECLAQLREQYERQRNVTCILHTALYAAWLLLASWGINWTQNKVFILALFFLAGILMIPVAQRRWNKRIQLVVNSEKMLTDF